MSMSKMEEEVGLRVGDMTCMGCVGRVERKLLESEGVEAVTVDLASKIAVVRGRGLDPMGLVAAVAELGKTAEVIGEGCTDFWVFEVQGMTCMSCVKRIREAIESVEGVCDVDVSLERKTAQVRVNGLTDPGRVVAAVAAVGKTAKKLDEAQAVQPPVVSSSEEKIRSTSLRDNDQTEEEENLLANEFESNVNVSTLLVGGMSCGSCVGKVEQMLMSVPGVYDARVSLMAGRAVVRYSDHQVDPKDLVKLLEQAGYQSGELKPEKTSNIVSLVFPTLHDAEMAANSFSNIPGVLDVQVLRVVEPPRSSILDCFCGPQDRRDSSSRVGVRVSLAPRGDSKNPKIEFVILARKQRKLWAEFVVVSSLQPELAGTVDPGSRFREEARQWLALLVVSLIFFSPLFVIHMILPNFPNWRVVLYSPVASSSATILDIASFLLATPIQLFCARKFYIGAYLAVFRRGRPNMDVLVAISSSTCYLYSLLLLVSWLIFGARSEHGAETVFHTAAMLITFVLLGKWLESKTKSSAADGISSMMALRPERATLMRKEGDKYHMEVPDVEVDLLLPGDLVRVPPGGSFPSDGEIEEGETVVDESMITGESKPVVKSCGEAVFGGTVNSSHSVIARITSTGEDTVLARIVEAVESAQATRAPIESIADKVSSVFVYGVLLLSILVFIVWYTLAKTGAIPTSWFEDSSPLSFSLTFSVAVMVIACPCALGLATPTAVMVATGQAARKFGLLFRHGAASLQAANTVGSVVLDKTGTLTVGHPVVTRFVNFRDGSSDIVGEREMMELEAIASAESCSEHPIGRAIQMYIEDRMSRPCRKSCENFEAVVGRGLKCSVGGRDIAVGNKDFIVSACCILRSELPSVVEEMEDAGFSVALAAVNGDMRFAFSVTDETRPEAWDVISWMHRRGLAVWMVTGDTLKAAELVGRKVGIDSTKILASCLPWEKANALERIKEENGGRVVFVGDGTNDAPALSAADVGIAMGAGTHIACDAADIVLVGSNLRDVATALDLAVQAFRTIRRNYAWALGYNIIAIPVAAGAAFPFTKVVLPPHLAAALMGLSSISVVLSSLALKLYQAPFTVTGQ
mmetsp:Transcript_16410/g.33444  ORF Transcript_16410/g.33444 Transcript_16410/m.33444 type:complete len:1088 (-) Transcript_16410:57-3320(-)